jgi:8-oxo-dGTP pyrophosphatase MutT (NUDIX family)
MAGFEFLEVHGEVAFAEAPTPALSPEQESAMNGLWEQRVRVNPLLFDGPVAAVAGVADDGRGRVEVSWMRTTFRRHALQRIPGTPRLVSLFVAVAQPTPAGILLGRAAAWTGSGAEHWVLPGGSMEPPEAGRPLRERMLREHAARELQEEAGLETDPEDLVRWAVVRNPDGSVGLFFRAPPISEVTARERFWAHVEGQQARGEPPELTGVQFAWEAAAVEGEVALTVPALLAHYAG